MIIFWRLVMAHLLADFTFQTNSVNRWKRSTWWGMFIHSGIHLAMNILATFPHLNDLWVDWGPVKLNGWFCVAALFLLHHLQDEWRIYTIKKFNRADGVIHFLWDQFVHIGLIFVFSPLIGFQHSGSLVPEAWPFLVSMFVCITHASTIIIYFLENYLYREPFPSFDQQYLTMAYRVILWLIFLMRGYHWVPYALVLCGYMVFLGRRGFVDFRRAGFYVGLLITVLAGLLSRMVYLGVI